MRVWVCYDRQTNGIVDVLDARQHVLTPDIRRTFLCVEETWTDEQFATFHKPLPLVPSLDNVDSLTMKAELEKRGFTVVPKGVQPIGR